jgi:alkylhydroperoxidase/carboxymuconolactone decarboxylase family protein YurZ
MAMNGTLIRAALRKSLGHIRYVSAVRPAAAHGLVEQVYRQTERDFGMLAPPVALHSPAPEALAATWLMLREALVAAGLADRATKEAVAATVSVANACPYCVDVHSTALNALDPGYEFPELTAWTNATTTRETAGRYEPPFPIEQVPELVGVVVTFHYLNRMVNVFLPDTPLPPGMPGAARRSALGVLGRFMRGTTRTVVSPGQSAGLVPAAVLPPDLAWAAGNPHVSQAFAAAAAAFDGLEVPDQVRALVDAELDGWTGEARGPSRAWVNDLVTALPAADRPAGRLALLAAFASYQIDAPMVEEFRRVRPDDRSLVELTAWASFAAARRAGGWIPVRKDQRTSGEDTGKHLGHA